jgi:hypothetical protein
MPTHAHGRERQRSPGDPVRVLHLPCDLPYTQKLSSPVIHVINGTRLADESEVPCHATFDWLCARDDLTFFDVLHIHFFEFTPVETLHRALDKCLTCGRRIIFTVHETAPMFPRNRPAYQEGLETICTAAHRVITLTRGGASALLTLVPCVDRRLVVIPHGFVLHPDSPAWGRAGSGGKRVEYALYGAFRPNRDTYTLLLNWYFGLLHHRARLNILSRAIAPPDLHDPALHIPEIMDFLQRDSERLRVVMAPYPADGQVVDFLSRCDVLLMPYTWGSHSGQLELAFDLSLLPVISDVGFYEEQWQASRGHVPEPIWLNWSDGNVYSYGARLVDALLTAQARIEAGGKSANSEAYRQHRIREHEEILRSHLQVYTDE